MAKSSKIWAEETLLTKELVMINPRLWCKIQVLKKTVACTNKHVMEKNATMCHAVLLKYKRD